MRKIIIELGIALATIIMLCDPALSAAADKPVKTLAEHEIKAAFLFNFLRYTRWPDNVLAKEKTFRLCVLGKNPFKTILQDLSKHETTHQLPMELMQLKSAEKISSCHAVFICQSERHHWRRIVENSAKRAVLTVSDISGFAPKGGMIGFYLQQNKVRFKINLEAMRAVELSADANLLRIATVVKSDDE